MDSRDGHPTTTLGVGCSPLRPVPSVKCTHVIGLEQVGGRVFPRKLFKLDEGHCDLTGFGVVISVLIKAESVG